ncbi:hypothetical protein D0Y65_048935, partial [Glycine soja]
MFISSNIDISQPARSKTLHSLFSFSSRLKSVGNRSLDTHIVPHCFQYCWKPVARTHKTPYTALGTVARRKPYIHSSARYEESFKFRAILLDLTAIVTVWVRVKIDWARSEQKVGTYIICVAFSSLLGNFQDNNNSCKATYFAAFVPLVNCSSLLVNY